MHPVRITNLDGRPSAGRSPAYGFVLALAVLGWAVGHRLGYLLDGHVLGEPNDGHGPFELIELTATVMAALALVAFGVALRRSGARARGALAPGRVLLPLLTLVPAGLFVAVELIEHTGQGVHPAVLGVGVLLQMLLGAAVFFASRRVLDVVEKLVAPRRPVPARAVTAPVPTVRGADRRVRPALLVTTDGTRAPPALLTTALVIS